MMLDYHMWVCLWHTIYNSSIYSTKKEGSDVKFYISFRSLFRWIEYIGVLLKYCFQSQCLHMNVVTGLRGPVRGFRVETPLVRRPRNFFMLLYVNVKMADESVSRDEIWRDLAGVWKTCSGVWEAYERRMRGVWKSCLGVWRTCSVVWPKVNTPFIRLNTTEHALHTVEHAFHTPLIRLLMGHKSH